MQNDDEPTMKTTMVFQRVQIGILCCDDAAEMVRLIFGNFLTILLHNGLSRRWMDCDSAGGCHGEAALVPVDLCP